MSKPRSATLIDEFHSRAHPSHDNAIDRKTERLTSSWLPGRFITVGRIRQVLWNGRVTRNGMFLRVSGLLLLIAGLTLFLFRQPILTYIANYLVVDDSPKPADAIIVLSGDVVSRCQTAANLFLAGWAPLVLITKGTYPYEEEALQRYGIQMMESYEKCLAILRFHTVPEGAVEILQGYEESTADEVSKVQDYLRIRRMNRLIIVTSNFHTRRTRLLFRRAFQSSGVEVSVHPTPPNSLFDPHNWWTRRRDSKTLLWEYQKLFFYTLGYW